ncbi:MAG: extradiol dioxygenase [Streptosporangiales bacterium]|nr:extradiol dioxygenase [Streptosporangiales bacterium]
MPLGHLGVNVTDLARAKAYYDGFMALVSYVPFHTGPDQLSYLPADEKPGTWVFFHPALEASPYSRHRPGLQHLAFIVKTRAAVHEAHRWAAARGSEILHAPREFPEYHPGYYAAFWLDPDGVMLEVVCHRDDA